LLHDSTVLQSLTFNDGSYTGDSFIFASDAKGGIFIADPTPWTNLTKGGPNPFLQSISFDNSGAEKFIFQPGFGAAAISDFSKTSGLADSIELDNFSGIASFKDVRPLLEATNGAEDTIIHLSPTDSITLSNVSVASLQASDFVIHHS
jgi:hypothetical protein